MIKEGILEKYLDALLRGDRKESRDVIEKTLQTGTPVNSVYADIVWPVMVEIEGLLRKEQIDPAAEHMATRINRTIVDQLQNKLPRKSSKEKMITVCCAPDEAQELGAQMMADLFESDGWNVKFIGGGLSNDDILAFVHKNPSDIFLIYGSTAKQAPGIRKLIDTIKEINANPNMKIMLSGGLFNRAEGLWQEMNADLFAPTAVEAIQVACGDLAVEPEETKTIKRRYKKQQVKASTKNTAPTTDNQEI